MRTADNINEHHRLERLGAKEIVGDDFNIKGWTVVSEHNEIMGDVEDLLYNPLTEKVRYVVLKVNADYSQDTPNRVLIPIGIAELHPEEDVVVLIGVEQQHLERLPSYNYEELSDEAEMAIRLVFGPATHEEFSTFNGDAFYGNTQFDTERLYRNRK